MLILRYVSPRRPLPLDCAACGLRFEQQAHWTADQEPVCDRCLEERYGHFVKCRTVGCHLFGEAAELVRGRCPACRAGRRTPAGRASEAAGRSITSTPAQPTATHRLAGHSELASEESAAVVRDTCAAVRAADADGTPVPEWMRTVHAIDQLLMEANSGASFEQYFRWASPGEIRRVVPALEALGLQQPAALVRDAISAAFPLGLPTDAAAQEAATQWTPGQEARLADLFARFEAWNGRVINTLGAFALRYGAGEDAQEPSE